MLAVTPAEVDAPKPLVFAGADSRSDAFKLKGLSYFIIEKLIELRDQSSAAAVASRITGTLLHVLSKEDVDHMLSHPHVLREVIQSAIQEQQQQQQQQQQQFQQHLQEQLMQQQQQRTHAELLAALVLVFVAMVLMHCFRRV